MKELHTIEKLINSLSKLPGVGQKTAERMAYSILNWKDEDISEFSNVLEETKRNISICPKCGSYIENDYCPICNDTNRDKTKLMIVTSPKDIITIEKSKVFQGQYHVINGVISLKNGLSVDNLDIPKLIDRIKNSEIKEIIIATNPDIDGETTALYISKKLEPLNLNITRLGYGLQVGANLDYVDAITLQKALEGRKKI